MTAVYRDANAKIVIFGEIIFATSEFEPLRQQYGVWTTSRETFEQDVPSMQSAVVILYGYNAKFQFTSNIILHQLPASVKYICKVAAGYDNIDVEACQQRGIHVSNTPRLVDNATADIAMTLMLMCARNVLNFHSSLRQGTWKQNIEYGFDLNGKVLGILGLGGIGKAVAKRAKAFGMKIQYYNRNPLSDQESKELGVDYVDFNSLLSTSDVISLNLPLNKHTRHIINAAAIDQMKPGVVLINTARGPVIEQQALIDGLASGKIASAGLDVFDQEPLPTDSPLLSLSNVVLLPHMGTDTIQTTRSMEQLAIDNVSWALLGKGLKTPVT